MRLMHLDMRPVDDLESTSVAFAAALDTLVKSAHPCHVDAVVLPLATALRVSVLELGSFQYLLIQRRMKLDPSGCLPERTLRPESAHSRKALPWALAALHKVQNVPCRPALKRQWGSTSHKTDVV